MSVQTVFILVLSAVALLSIILIRRSRSNNVDAANNEVYIGNLNYRTCEAELKRHFSQYGKINEIKIIKNNRTGRSKGYAFIRYSNDSEAENALASHGQELNSRSLVVRIAKSQAHD